MKAKSKNKPRLSGWVRLWIVTTVLSWLGGVVDLAMSREPLQWPPPFGDATPTSARHLLWFLGPLAVAVVWVATRWIWRGFRPPPDESSAPHMGTMEIVRHALRVLAKTGLALFWMACAGAFVMAGVMIGASKGTNKSFWDELFIAFQFLIAAWFAWQAWEQLTEPADDGGDSSSG